MADSIPSRPLLLVLLGLAALGAFSLPSFGQTGPLQAQAPAVQPARYSSELATLGPTLKVLSVLDTQTGAVKLYSFADVLDAQGKPTGRFTAVPVTITGQ